jgi:hypothetical protein
MSTLDKTLLLLWVMDYVTTSSTLKRLDERVHALEAASTQEFQQSQQITEFDGLTTPTVAPSVPSLTQLLVGANGTLYLWSVATQRWQSLITT